MNPIDARALIAEIESSGKKLKPYDLGFINDMKSRVERGQYLIGNQGNYLQKLYRTIQQGNFVQKEKIR